MNCCEKDEEVENLTVRKIPRPPNAFMLFANANRKLMAQKYPTESNKDISKRLGSCWKSLEPVEKNKYFDKAKIIDSEHKKKYPNYVYNPKEARIRKAMRDANRDRSIGTSPMLARLGERLPSHSEWAQPQEDPMMMNPMNEMRRMDYQMPNSENHYIPPMDSYNKMNSASMVPNYMQPSPLAQLQQQQSEMWHPYQKNLQSRPLGSQFHRPMIQDMQQPQYMPQEPVQDNPTNLIMEKPQESPPACMSQMHTDPGLPIASENNAIATSSSPCCGTPERPKSGHGSQQHYLEAGASVDCMQTPMVDSKMSQRDQYMQGSEAVGGRKNFEVAPKVETPVIVKKNSQESCYKPLGGKQSCTVRAGFCPPNNFFNDEYQMDYITKYFATLPDYTLTTINTADGFSFPYASLTPKGPKAVENFLELSGIREEPILIATECGYIPVLEVDPLN